MNTDKHLIKNENKPLCAISSPFINSIFLEANKAIDECVMKTGLTREQVILYVSGKVDRHKLLVTWCKDC